MNKEEFIEKIQEIGFKPRILNGKKAGEGIYIRGEKEKKYHTIICSGGEIMVIDPNYEWLDCGDPKDYDHILEVLKEKGV